MPGSGPGGLEPRQRSSYTRAIRRIGQAAVRHVALLHGIARITECARGVVEQGLLLGGSHQAEQGAGLRVVVGVGLVVPVGGRTLQRQRRLVQRQS